MLTGIRSGLDVRAVLLPKDLFKILDVFTTPVVTNVNQDVPRAEEEGHPLRGAAAQPRSVAEQIRRCRRRR